MGETLTHKLIRSHLADGSMNPGDEVAINMDQALLQDATGTLAWLEFEQMGQDAVTIRQATQYVDHNILQTGYENADDHRFLRSVCQRYGAIFSGPGNGISHWAHMERFDMPGETMLGCDSHTPHAGACGMLAIGAGGLGRERDGGRAVPAHDARGSPDQTHGEIQTLGEREGRDLGTAEPFRRQVGEEQSPRVCRSRAEGAARPFPGDDREHGHGTRRDRFGVPGGWADETVPHRPRPGEGLQAARPRR